MCSCRSNVNPGMIKQNTFKPPRWLTIAFWTRRACNQDRKQFFQEAWSPNGCKEVARVQRLHTPCRQRGCFRGRRGRRAPRGAQTCRVAACTRSAAAAPPARPAPLRPAAGSTALCCATAHRKHACTRRSNHFLWLSTERALSGHSFWQELHPLAPADPPRNSAPAHGQSSKRVPKMCLDQAVTDVM